MTKQMGLIALVVVGMLIFIGGWFAGRAMSPYYASHPIVFNGDTSQACVPIGGYPQALTDLQSEGIALKESASPTVAAAQTALPATVGTTKAFVGSKNSDLYHDPSCTAVKRIKEENQVWFSSRGEAEAAGYIPSECTKEKLGI